MESSLSLSEISVVKETVFLQLILFKAYFSCSFQFGLQMQITLLWVNLFLCSRLYSFAYIHLCMMSLNRNMNFLIVGGMKTKNLLVELPKVSRFQLHEYELGSGD